MTERIKNYIKQSSIRVKYLTVFLGVTLLSYFWIVHFANVKVQQYEKENSDNYNVYSNTFYDSRIRSI